MMNNVAALIESWFAEQEDEFVVYGRDYASQLYGHVASAERLIYTTKYHATMRVADRLFGRKIAILGRPGLPTLEDLQALTTTSKEIVFLGDADPPDLLAFAWLRSHVHIEFLGVNDRFLDEHFTGSLDRTLISLSNSEMMSRDFLTHILPDYPTLLGPYCTQRIASGFKVELEGATKSIGT